MTVKEERELWESLFGYAEELEELDRTQMIGGGGYILGAYEGTRSELAELGYSEEAVDGYAEIYAVNFC